MNAYDKRLVRCGAVFILFGITTLGFILLPDIRSGPWPLPASIALLAVWWLIAGITLIRRSRWMYLFATPLAAILVIAPPIGTTLAVMIGSSWFKRRQTHEIAPHLRNHTSMHLRDC